MELKKTLIRDILLSTDIPELNLGERVGDTGYIDFIKINEISSPLMRGVDIYNRTFFTICADIIYTDEMRVPTFTTIFKRYSDESCLWHAAGFYRKIMNTEGGMNIPQLGLIRNLVKYGEVSLQDGRDDETIENLRLCNYDIGTDGAIKRTFIFKRPLKIILSLGGSVEYEL